MSESRQPITDDGLRALILRQLERVPQDCRNRYAKRVEAMGAKLIAAEIVRAMRQARWTVDGPVHDPDGSHVGYAKPHGSKSDGT